ncbi:MAG TPA: type II secretion system protein GspM [Sphingobium sp.]|uniref:type II secretion system protein GspM n=1 Tax=Sphingobium sp. TaxID=1912891 RepID=UPI002ED1183B
MKAIRHWWSALSERERRLVALMLLLVGGVLLWLGVWRPVQAGIADGRTRYGAAVDANAAVRAKVRLLKHMGPGAAHSDAPIGQSVAQTASEAGLTLDRSAAQGEGRLAITIGSARAGALLAWLSGLEARGVLVETISVTPGTTPGTVVVQAVLREAA